MEQKQTAHEIIAQKYQKYIRPILLKHQNEFNRRQQNTNDAMGMFSCLHSCDNINPKTCSIIIIVGAIIITLAAIHPAFFALFVALTPVVCVAFFIRGLIKAVSKLSETKNVLTPEYMLEIKKEVLPVFCKFFKDLHWQHGKSDVEIYEKSYVLYNKTCPKISVDDSFYGTHKGVKFEILEAVSTAKLGNDVAINTVYKNILIKLEIKKNFLGHTLICPKEYPKVPELNKTELEDVLFQIKFDVYTNNEVEARYVVTAKLMEKLNNLMQKFGTNNISFAFYYNNFVICMPTNKEDLFSTDTYDTNLDDEKIYIRLFEEIMEVYEVIDYFKEV